MSADKKQQSFISYVWKLVVGIFFLFGFGLICPSWGGITRQGITAIGIFIGTVWMIVMGFNLIPSCILSMAASLMSGFYTSATLLTSTFGSATIVQLFFCYALCQALIITGAGEFFAKWIISRKKIQGRPFLFSAAFMIAVFCLGAFVGTVGGLILAYTIQDYIKDTIGYEEDSDWHMITCLGLQTSAMIGSSLLPFKGIALSIFNSIMEPLAAMGFELNFAIYMISITVFFALYVVVFNLFSLYIFRIDMSKLKSFDITKMEGMQNLKITKQQKFVSFVVLCGMMYSILLLFIPKSTGFYGWLSGIGQPLWFALMVSVICLFKVDNKPVVNPEQLFGKIFWGVVLAIAAFTAVGAMLSNNDLGVKTWLSVMLGPLFEDMAFPVFMLVLVGTATVITNFFSNLATGLIIGSLVSPFVVTYATVNGYNGSVIGAALACSCFFAFLTMASAGPAPLLLGKPGYIKRPGFIWTHGVPVMLMGIVLMWITFTAIAVVC